MDHAATTPVEAEVTKAMEIYFGEDYGNPSSVHRWGQRAEHAVASARQQIGDIVGCQSSEVVFTSGGSESDNLALRGAAMAARSAGRGNHLVVTAIEHYAVLNTARQLRELYDFDLTVLPVDSFGLVSVDHVAAAIRPDTILVSVMCANNEIGVLQPVAEIAQVVRPHGVLMHTDAVQAASQMELNVDTLGVDMMSLGAHKFYGPKGVGVLYVRNGVSLEPVMTGGGQEQGLRSGTHNVAQITGMAVALKLTAERRERDNQHYAGHRDQLIEGILQNIPDARLTGHPEKRLHNNASFVFRGINGNELIMQLDLAGVAAGSGSACKTGSPAPSSVLLALGIEPEWALGSLRLTVGRGTTGDEVDLVQEIVPDVISRMRKA